MLNKRITRFLVPLLTCLAISLAILPCVRAAAAPGDEVTANWGVKRTKTASDGNTYTYWEDADGTVSAFIGEDDVTWLYLEYIDPHTLHAQPTYVSAWIGIGNFLRMDGTPLFKEGSRFYVRLLQPHSADWAELWNQIDVQKRSRLDPDRAQFVKIGVTDPDGREYTDLSDLTELFVQYSSAFNIFFSEDIDEGNVAHIDKMLPMNGIFAPESGRYAVFLLHQFGENFVLDSSGNAFYVSSAGSMIADGDVPLVLSLCIASCVAGIAIGAVVTLLICKKRKPAPADGGAAENGAEETHE